MRAHEFIKEVLDISGAAPSTEWQSGVDDFGNHVTAGQWKDQTGQTVTHEFEKNPNGEVKMKFNRSNPAGGNDYSVTGSGQGKQASIMTGVARNIRDYMNDNPDAHTYNFSSSADSRTRAYDRMIDKVAPQMGFVGTKEYDPETQRTNYSLKRAQDGETHTPLVQPQKSTEPKAPAVQNVVVPPPTASKNPTSGVSLTGRAPTSPEDVTHAYRNMSQAELSNAQDTGHFHANPNPRYGAKTNEKWWSSGDAEGPYGRNWKTGDSKVQVRVPISKVPSDTAVNASHAEVFNRETGKWSPVTPTTTQPKAPVPTAKPAAPTIPTPIPPTLPAAPMRAGGGAGSSGSVGGSSGGMGGGGMRGTTLGTTLRDLNPYKIPYN